MILIRIIPLKTLAGLDLHNLEQFGFTLVQRGDNIQVWVERSVYRA